MTAITNLLAFFALGVTLVLVWRQSWRGRVRLFVVQSILLGVLAAAIGGLARRPALVLVAAIFLLVKTWLIPRWALMPTEARRDSLRSALSAPIDGASRSMAKRPMRVFTNLHEARKWLDEIFKVELKR